MKIPFPNEYAKEHGHNPFPPRWERWLSAAREAILSAQPQAGRNVTVDEHPGKGTVINVDDTSTRRHPTGGGGGGPPPSATGACCHADGSCTVLTASACTAAGGAYLGDHTICSPNPCTHTLCKCGFSDCDGTRYYLTRTIVTNWDDQWTSTSSETGTHEICRTTGTSTVISSYTLNLDGSCTGPTDTSCTGSAHTKSSGIDGCGVMDADCTTTDCTHTTCTSCWNYGRCIAWAAEHANPDTDVCTGTTRTRSNSIDYDTGGDPSDHAVGSNIETTTLSDEYTNDMLIANALALVTCAEGLTKVYTLNAAETCCTVRCI